MLLKNLPRLSAFLLVAVLACTCIAPTAYAVGPEAEPEIIDAEVIEEVTEETEPVIDEIPDDLYQAYVLGCLFFFVIVIVFYFSYKLFAMFF